jgi:hypothetical protein
VVTAADLPPAAEPDGLAGPQPQSGFAGRFLVFYALLGAVLAAALTGLVLVALQPGRPKPAPWSNWRPTTGSAQSITDQIASHIGAQYMLNHTGSQLVAIVPGQPEVTQDTKVSKVSTIAIRSSPTSNSFSRIIGTGGNVQEQFCGLGVACSIATGTPTAERERLLRREALEVALYTFKFVPSVSAVIAYMPPAPGQAASTLLYLERSNLAQELARPLSSTLPLLNPPLPSQADRKESHTIDALTLPVEYGFQYQALTGGTEAMILTPSA